MYNDAQATLHNNIIWNNGTNDVYTSNNGITTASCNLIGTSNTNLIGNNNIIGEDPLFVDNGIYSLQENSPAIDKGNNIYLTAEIDLADKPRINNGIVDLGAYEYQQDIQTFVVETQCIASLRVVGYYDILGQKLSHKPQSGLYIIIYNNGQTEKIIKN